MIRKVLVSVTIVLAVTCAGRVHASDDDWHLQIDDQENDIALYYRRLPSGLYEFRGITFIKSNLSGFVALFRDTESMPKWVDRAQKATNLKQVSDTEVYAHMITSMPFPFTYRHSVVRTRIFQDAQTGEVIIQGEDAEPGYLDALSDEKRKWVNEASKKYVLIRDLKSHWAFRPLGGGVVKVEFQGSGNPGGLLEKFIPQRLLRMVVWEAPYNTLKGMRRIVKDDKYQSSSFSFIQEY